MLHARLLGFVHPTTGEEMSFEAPLPEDFKKLIAMLKPYAQG
jgi:23S rRNA pseudouridine1911/1915/1917 synthase